MIGMMYLVLTAMLALNVSADIINGFSKLRHSMESSMGATYNRTQNIMETFEYEYNKDEAGKAKYGDWYAVAKDIFNKSEEFYYYIENFKLAIANDVDGAEYKEMPEKLKGGSDTNKPHAYAFNMRDPETGRINAEELKYRMEDYVKYMTTADSPCLAERMSRPSFKKEWDEKTSMVEALFNTDDMTNEEGERISWEASIFHEMPAAAVTAMLTKYQNDINTVEYDWVHFMFQQTSASTFIANKVEALVMPTNGEYIMQGQHYRAKIVSAMVDTNSVPRVFIGNQEVTNGVYDITATSPGEHKFNGYMLIGDDTTHYAFSGQYTVGVPSATISNVDLDIMYRGYDNKFKVTVPGVKDDQVSITVDGATARLTSEGWIIRPSDAAKTVTINVIAKMDGQPKSMGSQVFRVKPMPTPQGSIKNGDREYADGESVPSARWNANTQVIASYGKDGVLNVPFVVTGFTLSVNGSEYTSNSDRLTRDMLDKIGKAKAGARVTIEKIRAKSTQAGSKEQGLNSFTVKTAY